MKHNFRELTIWKEAMEVVKMVYELTSKLPDSEKFGLISQMQRSAVSIPSNIAEGSGRVSDKELMYFLNVAISSSYELETQILLLEELYGIQNENLIPKLNALQKMIGGFKRMVRNA